MRQALTPTPKITAYAKAFKTGGMDYAGTMAAKKVGRHTIKATAPLVGQAYNANGPQPVGTLSEDVGTGQNHLSISMKRGGGPRNPDHSGGGRSGHKAVMSGKY